MHIVIDCDPGIDDIVAIAVALSRIPENVKVEAITVVDGNTSLENSLNNVATALKQMNRCDIPVYKGSARSLLGFDKVEIPLPFHIHGERGLGSFVSSGHELREINLIPNKSAAEGLIEIARKFSGTLHVIALAPLTNIALAIRLDPTFPQHLAGLHIMGGDYGTVFKRYGAEYNFFKDPEAANVVMREAVGHCPVNMVPFDTCYTSTTNCHFEWFDSVVPETSQFGRFMRSIYIPYRYNVTTFSSCDGLAMVAFLVPGAVETAEEFTPDCSVQLEHYEKPVVSERCPGGQRGCLVLGNKIQPGSIELNGHKFGLRIITSVHEQSFQTAFANAISYFSEKVHCG